MLEHLFSPLLVNKMRLKNRCVVAPMVSVYVASVPPCKGAIADFTAWQMKKPVDALAMGSHILQALSGGVLLTTRSGASVNTMTITWGMLGIDWGLPVFITLVRTSRLSYQYLLENPQFTINVPTGPIDRRILGVAGTKSGRDMDKISGLGLHLEKPEKISVPGIRELPLTLECEVIYKQAQDPAAIPAELRAAYHPASGADLSKALNKTYHTAFYGAIVSAYIIE